MCNNVLFESVEEAAQMFGKIDLGDVNAMPIVIW